MARVYKTRFPFPSDYNPSFSGNISGTIFVSLIHCFSNLDAFPSSFVKMRSIFLISLMVYSPWMVSSSGELERIFPRAEPACRTIEKNISSASKVYYAGEDHAFPEDRGCKLI